MTRLPKKPKKLLRIPNAVPAMSGEVAKLDAKVAVAVGRLTRIKGFHRLITAWQQVAEAHPDWTLRIIGAGPQQEALAAQITEAGLDGKVELPGSTADVGAELEKASMYVLSSRHEGFPMTILEAMAKGLAIVSFNSPHGPKEMLTNEVDGLLVKPRTNANLAAAILRVIEDEPLRRQLAAGGLGPPAATTSPPSAPAGRASWTPCSPAAPRRRRPSRSTSDPVSSTGSAMTSPPSRSWSRCTGGSVPAPAWPPRCATPAWTRPATPSPPAEEHDRPSGSIGRPVMNLSRNRFTPLTVSTSPTAGISLENLRTAPGRRA